MNKENIIKELKQIEHIIEDEWPVEDGNSIYESPEMLALEEAIAIIKADKSEYNEGVTRAIDSRDLINKIKEEQGVENLYFRREYNKDEDDIIFRKVKTEKVIPIKTVINLIDSCETIPVIINKYIKA